jgi:predicted  nucleic acid-binding Zn-ribbon protein
LRGGCLACASNCAKDYVKQSAGEEHLMKNEQLQSLIATLHKELTAAKSVDADSRVLLQQLMQDIEDLADEDETPAERVESATGQLESATLKFESEHPKLSMTLGEIMDALGKLGI